MKINTQEKYVMEQKKEDAFEYAIEKGNIVFIGFEYAAK